MTIFLATSEDSGFTGAPQVPTVSTTAGRFRAGYSRCAVSLASANVSATDPPANRIQLLPFTATNLLWTHFVALDAQTFYTANMQSVIFKSPDGVTRLTIRTPTATYGTLAMYSRNAAGVFTQLGSTFSSPNNVSLTTMDIKIDYTASGGIQIWNNATLIYTFSGDPRTDAATALNTVELTSFNSTGGGFTYFSEIILADQDTRGMALVTIPPTAAGNTQLWTPNTVGNINEITTSDATMVSSSTNDQLSEWAVTGATMPTGAYTVLAMVEEARVSVGASAPLHYDYAVRVGSTDYLAGASIAPTGAFANYQRVWPVNPATGVAWLPGDFTAAGFNYGLKSLT